MKGAMLTLHLQRRFLSKYNFFISVRKGGESTLIKDIKQVYVKEIIKYETENCNNSEEKNNKKKVKHLIRLSKSNGGVQIKCSPSFIYLLSLKCGYIESIWLNVAKNTTCTSLTCLRHIIKNVPWDTYIYPNYLKGIPLKITALKSKLFDTLSIRNVINEELNEYIRVYQCDIRTPTNISSSPFISHTNNTTLSEQYDLGYSSYGKDKVNTINTVDMIIHPQSESRNEINANIEDQNDGGIKKNIWNLLAVHIENNLCNVDLKFTGKLSPRFYEYEYIDQLSNVANADKYENLNFYSLFRNDYSINDEQIRNIVTTNVPMWSVSEEKKKIQLKYQNDITGVDYINVGRNCINGEKTNYYNYKYFQNTKGISRGPSPPLNLCKPGEPSSSPETCTLFKAEEKSINSIHSMGNKVEKKRINSIYTVEGKKWTSKRHINLDTNESKMCNHMNHSKRGDICETDPSIGKDSFLNEKLKEEYHTQKRKSIVAINHDMAKDELVKCHTVAGEDEPIFFKRPISESGNDYISGRNNNSEYILNRLQDMEIKRMNHLNNNFFLSDDCYDSASCIYSLAIHKCIRNRKRVNLIWDPFCSNGSIIFELLFFFLNMPIYSHKEILPFMNLKIYDQQEFENIYQYILDNMNNANNYHTQLIGTDNRSIMIAQCKKNLVRCALYHKDTFKKIKKNRNSASVGSSSHEQDENLSFSNENYLKRNSFLEGVLRDHVLDDHVDMHEEEMKDDHPEISHVDESQEMNHVRDMDALLRIQKAPKGDRTKSQCGTHQNGIHQNGIHQNGIHQNGIHQNGIHQNESPRKSVMESKQNITAPDVDTISISTSEDQKYNLEFPLDISFHKAHFFNVVPFVKNATIITKIPHFSFSKELGINKKTLTLYEQFEQMLSSRSDWKGVYVFIRNQVFLNKSKLEWNKMMSLRDSKGRQLTLLSWTGRKKNLYSFSTEDDKLRELERFSENLSFQN
ncbi:hypothetical protein, conserved [Plasmodium gonderi]|uniref:Methyltransferase n=1 Tax=Plasmodium gonderi TaxID=77519 RepID=A0A1Y1JM19_PLAGO|nr:hypothetical protein, conserved [Plasmodium gonderi]GAW83636.1 hypothetical protein, conserved [Plasmodium gonderi]